MIAIYVRLIQRGLKTLEEVPKNLREEVEKELAKWKE